MIESYQKTNSVGDAIAVMIEAYTQLGQNDLATSSKLVLQKNYPNHGYLNGEEIDLDKNIFSLKDLWIFTKRK